MFDDSIDSAKKNFVKYLDNLSLTPASHKNYRSDLNHFTGWLILRVRSFGSYVETLTDAVPFLSKKISLEYRTFLIENKIPAKTINRRLSTLRHLAKFFVSSNLMDRGFMDGVENVGSGGTFKNIPRPVVNGFQSFLEAEKVSKSTVKNYMSDVKQFLAWLESNQKILNS